MNWTAAARGIATGAVGVLVAAAVVLAQGALLGETLASGPGWELKVRSSPVDSSIFYGDPQRSGGARGLARPGLLSEVIIYTPPDTAEAYVVGLVPADAASVWVSVTGESWTKADVRHVLGAPVYLATVDSERHGVVIETRDDEGRRVERLETPPPLPPPPPRPSPGIALGGS